MKMIVKLIIRPVVALVVSALFLIASIGMRSEYKNYMNKLVNVRATVVEVIDAYDDEDDAIYIDYTLHRTEYKHVRLVFSDYYNIEEGDKIDVKIDPSDPYNLDSKYGLGPASIMALAVSLLSLVAGLVILVQELMLALKTVAYGKVLLDNQEAVAKSIDSMMTQ